VPDPAERVGSNSQLVGMALVTACLGVTAASFYERSTNGSWTTGSGSTCSSARPIRSRTSPTVFLGAGIGGLFACHVGPLALHEPPLSAADPLGRSLTSATWRSGRLECSLASAWIAAGGDSPQRSSAVPQAFRDLGRRATRGVVRWSIRTRSARGRVRNRSGGSSVTASPSTPAGTERSESTS